MQVELQRDCPKCGAAVESMPDRGEIRCEYCHTLIDVLPEPVVALEKVVVVKGPPPRPPRPDPIEALRAELKQAERALGRCKTLVLLSVFLVMLPGIGIAVGGAVPFGINGYLVPALVFGIVGGLVAALGIVLVSVLANREKVLKADIKDIHRRMGIDTRNIAEKLLDGGLNWMLGTRK